MPMPPMPTKWTGPNSVGSFIHRLRPANAGNLQDEIGQTVRRVWNAGLFRGRGALRQGTGICEYLRELAAEIFRRKRSLRDHIGCAGDGEMRGVGALILI